MKFLRIAKFAAFLLAALALAGYAFLKSIDPNRYRTLVAAQVQSLTGRAVVINGDMEWRPSLHPALMVHDISIANASWGSRPDMARAKSLEVQVELLPLLLSRDLNIDKLALIGADILLETNAQGAGNWRFKGADGRDLGGAPDIDSIEIRDSVLAYRAHKDGQSIDLALHDLAATSEPSGLRIAMRGAAMGVPFDLHGVLGPLARLSEAQGEPYPLDLSGHVGPAEIRAIGSIKNPQAGTGVQVKLTASAKSLDALSEAVGTALPAIGPFSLSASASEIPNGIRLSEMHLIAGKTELTGEATLAAGKLRPHLGADVDATFLDIDALTGWHPGESAHTERMFGDTPLALGALSALDAKVTLRAAQARFHGLNLDKLETKGALQDGFLTVQPFKTRLAQADLQGDITVQADRPRPIIRARIEARHLPVGTLLPSLGERIVGNVDLRADLHGQGATPHTLVSSLNGTFDAVMGQGRVNNFDLDVLAADLLRSLIPWAASSDSTRISCFVSHFDLKDGLATSKVLLLDTQNITVLGQGTVNFGNERLDFLLKPKAKDITLSMPIAVRVRGHISRPSASPDAASLAMDAASLAAGLVNPLGLLVPLINLGGEDNPCLAALKSAPSRSTHLALPPVPGANIIEGVFDWLGRIGR